MLKHMMLKTTYARTQYTEKRNCEPKQTNKQNKKTT